MDELSGVGVVTDVLRVIPTVNPRHGGPVAAMRSSIEAMTSAGVSTTVVTADSPAIAEEYAGDLKVIGLGPTHGRWGYSRKMRPWLDGHVHSYDAVVLHGIWPYLASAAAGACRGVDVPYVAFPHGSLDPWFRRNQPLRYWRKYLTWPWAQYPLMRGAGAVLYTTEEERGRSCAAFRPWSSSGEVVAYGVRGAPEFRDRAKWGERFGEPYVLYLGRIHEKKGLDLLIAALAKEPRLLAGRRLVIAGPDAGGLGAKLRDMARGAGVDEHIDWLEHVDGAEKWGLLTSADALVLPSHTENYGVVVAEACSAGTPVLVTTGVCLAGDVERGGAGFSAPPTIDGVVELFERFGSMSLEERRAMGDAARRLYADQMTHETAASELLAVLERIVKSHQASHGS